MADRAPRGKISAAFTLVELLMATAVTGVILSAVVMLSEALASYSNQGEATAELATHARFALGSSRYCLQSEVREARAVALSASGDLVCWLGDLDEDNRMALKEFVIFYHNAGEGTLRRVTYAAGPVLAGIGPSYMSQVLTSLESGGLTAACPSGYGKQELVVARHVSLALFRLNAAYPRARAVEYLVTFSRHQNRIEDSGEEIELSFYGSATMRSPHQGDGFE